MTYTITESLLKQIGAEFYCLRINSGEKLINVAMATGLTQSTISKIEHGRYKNPSITLLKRIAAHFKHDLSVVFTPLD